jgi:outer membrane protein assembly factor BamB
MVGVAAIVIVFGLAFGVRGVGAADVELPLTVAPTWAPNGAVNAIARVGDLTYVGGSFTRIGPPTGNAVVFDRRSGARRTGWPVVSGGSVTALSPDGRGGWFVAGEFTRVGDVARRGLARITSAGGVDRRWTRATVDPTALAVDGRHVYLADDSGISALGRSTGKVRWRVPIGEVLALTAVGERLYVGGVFEKVRGAVRRGFAALDARTGRLLPIDLRLRVDPCYFRRMGECEAIPVVEAVAVASGRLLVAGVFDHVHRTLRRGFATFDMNGRLAPWPWQLARNELGTVVEIQPSGSDVYVGGSFTRLGSVRRSHLAVVDAHSGAIRKWAPGGIGTVRALAVASDAVYAAAAGTSTEDLVALDRRRGVPLTWRDVPDDAVHAIATSGRLLLAGGAFQSVGGVARRGLAALGPDGTPTPWTADVSGGIDEVNTLLVHDEHLYIGGWFDQVQGQPRANLGAFTLDGRLTAWAPPADNGVYELAGHGSAILAAGHFTHVDGRARGGVAAIDARSGAVLDWDASTDWFALAVAVDGDRVYIGGRFATVNGAERPNAAAVRADDGTVLSWAPLPDSVVWVFLPLGDEVIVGGVFDEIGGVDHTALAALGREDGRVRPWLPPVDGLPIGALARLGPYLLVGGSFDSIGGAKRSSIAAIEIGRGTIADWDLRLPADSASEITVIAPLRDEIVLGGTFTTILGKVQPNFAILRR